MKVYDLKDLYGMLVSTANSCEYKEWPRILLDLEKFSDYKLDFRGRHQVALLPKH